MPPAFVYLIFTAICLFVLAQVNHQILLQIIYLMLRATGSANAAITVYFLIVFPGILVHESAHWIVAKLLGLRPSAFSVWPELEGYSLRLGYVQMRRGDLFSESLVGAAPLVTGLVLITLISQQIFTMNSVIDSLTLGGLSSGLSELRQILFRVDRLFWLYLLFALANGMMLSTSDREPVRPILGFTLFAILTFIVTGVPLAPVGSLLAALYPALEALVTSLLLILFVDVAALFTLGVFGVFVIPLK